MERERRRGRVPEPPWWPWASMPCRLLALLFGAIAVVAVAGLTAPHHAHSKGTVVRAPGKLGPADCVPGSRPRVAFGASETKALVLGCAEMSDGARVLVAAEHERPVGFGPRGLVCFYVAPEGRRDVDPRCADLSPRCCPGEDSPLFGDDGISIGKAVRVGERKPIYVSGEASQRLGSVIVSYRMPSGQTRESLAEPILIGPRLAHRLGPVRPFAYVVGEVPAAADTCRGIAVDGRDRRGLRVERESLQRVARAYQSAPLGLPRSDQCGARAVGSSIVDAVGMALSGFRSLLG